MRQWRKTCALTPSPAGQAQERWELWEDERILASYPVQVRTGKPLDVVGFKSPRLDELKSYAAHLAASARQLYAPEAALSALPACPACLLDSAQVEPQAAILGVAYGRCPRCGHLFVPRQPSTQAWESFFSASDEHAAAYTDSQAIEQRLAQVVMPKAQWLTQAYQDLYGRAPASLVDVGAGGGHFVEGARRLGCQAQGYELSRASRAFARQNFGLDLRGDDFNRLPPQAGSLDVVTFWGLLEYTPKPRRFLETAHACLGRRESLLVLEVPRHDCLGSALQQAVPTRIARHLDPTSHVNCFSDASLAWALHDCGFTPVAAWYFGMDAYELLLQLAWELDDQEIIARCAPLLLPLQACLDAGRVCDDLVVAAVPREDVP